MWIKEGLTFDDVTLRPKYSAIPSRADVDLSVKLPKEITLKIPIVSANMKHVTEVAMANAIGELGGLALLHRFCEPEQQIKMFKECKYKDNVGCSVGIKEDDLKLVDMAVKASCRIICIDVAHAHNHAVGHFCASIAERYPDVLLIAGAVATDDGTKFLAHCGVDLIRINIGAGSICTTRIQTGNGVPQLTALDESYQTCNEHNALILADGGMSKPADFVKALCFSHATLTGNMLAGTDETPGSKIIVDGLAYKEYAGSSTFKNKHIEGVSGLVPYKGPVAKVVETILEGIRSGCSYQGATTLAQLRKDPQFYKISNAGLIESHAHDILVR
jgi:IMP dehydrogenase